MVMWIIESRSGFVHYGLNQDIWIVTVDYFALFCCVSCCSDLIILDLEVLGFDDPAMASCESDVAPDFFDIDSLLARSTKVTCTFNSGTPREVYELLGTNPPHYTGEKGYQVLTPFWFVRALEPFCSLTIPMAYNSNVRNVLLANAAHTNLDALQPYYYEMGMHLSHSVSESVGNEIAECLLEAITQRIGDIMLRTMIGSEITNKIDNLEKKLYEESEKCRSRLHAYFSSQQITKNRKRRLL
ncbi:partner of SLD five, PSF3 [Dictyocaulus viviparus]|uniref:DNA replication complex GINS protein PSF3 n=1 Tax=Dictyocaulus viviparus TaxID=29172 RepID=A0A0D8XD63_DICVI|nr:partner of SLD five, PSF3 [Dictyocaulus viviparus]